MRPLLVLLISMGLVAVSPPALADDASEARLQYELGSELYRQKRFAEALERFIASNRLVPNPNVVFNIANIYVLLGKREARKSPARSGEWYVEAFNWADTLSRMVSTEADIQDAARLRASILPRVAVVRVDSEPAGGDIFVDRESLGSVGRTPREVATIPGEHPIIVKREGYRPASVQALARMGAVTPVRLKLEKIVGVVQLSSQPTGARVQYFPGGVDLGLTPMVAHLPTGEGRLIVSLSGYLSQTREIVVRDGETVKLEVDLPRAADRGARLTVVGQPDGAQVRLGGRPVGKLPLTLSGLDPGRQSLEVAADRHQPWRGDLLLEAGEATRVEATLLRPEDRAWGGWKWLGYGAGAGLLATGGVFGWQARQARSDFQDSPSSAGKDRLDRLNLRADLLLGSAAFTLVTTALLHAVLSGPSDSHASISNSGN